MKRRLLAFAAGLSIALVAAPAHGQSVNISSQFIHPTQGIVTSGYGWRWGRMHRGIDYGAPIATPILAAASGTVTFAGWNRGGYGNLVEIEHPDGNSTRYAHASRILVRADDWVEQGQLIGEVGSTGRSTGPHLHFEIHLSNGEAVNPIAYLPQIIARR